MKKWSDSELKSHALNLWANYLETGDVAMSAETARNIGRQREVNDLPERKRELVGRMRKLALDELNAARPTRD